MQHILSVDQFTVGNISKLFERATYHLRNNDYLRAGHYPIPCYSASGKVLTNLFYEPSTRTSSSFYAAMVRLGGSVIPINDVTFSSVVKGETLEDTIRTLQCYSDVIVLRHKETGAADRAAAVASVPIINAGDGTGEHPTQALLDYFTICIEMFGKVRPDAPFHVVMMGDLLHGRTIKSLAKLLRRGDRLSTSVRVSWVSPEKLRVPSEFVMSGEIETTELNDVIDDADVLYVTRVQRERMTMDDVFDYAVTTEHMARAKPTMILMHPLPRVNEIPQSLDADPRAVYFKQMRYGMFIRMALLEDVLCDEVMNAAATWRRSEIMQR